MCWHKKGSWYVVRVECGYEYSFADIRREVTHIHYIRRPNLKHKTVTVNGHWTYQQLFGTPREIT